MNVIAVKITPCNKFANGKRMFVCNIDGTAYFRYAYNLGQARIIFEDLVLSKGYTLLENVTVDFNISLNTIINENLIIIG